MPPARRFRSCERPPRASSPALADTQRGQRDVDSPDVGRNLFFESVMLTTTSKTLGAAKASVFRRVTTTSFLHRGFLISSSTMRPLTFPVARSTTTEYSDSPTVLASVLY